jgi:uncharacterized protein involved in exopolysaccharide biosynthesis
MLQDTDNSAAICLASLKQRLTAQRCEYELLQMLSLDQGLDRLRDKGGASPQAGDAADKLSAMGGELMDADYFRTKQQLLLLQAEKDEMGRYLRTNHPKMVAMSDEIAQRERLLKILRAQSVERLEGKKASLTLEIQNLEREVKQWAAQMADNQHHTLESQWKTVEYDKLKSNAQRIQSFHDRLLATMQTLDVNKEINTESVVIMEPASQAYPAPQVGTKKVAGALVGLALSVGLLLLTGLGRSRAAHPGPQPLPAASRRDPPECQ